MDMEAKIDKLENILKKYNSLEVVKYLAFWLTRVSERHVHPFFNGLLSPYKQIHYVASLALKNNSKGLNNISNDDWSAILAILLEIEEDYNKVIPGDFQKSNAEITNKKGVAQASFLNYFFQGTLAFKEQVIDKIEKTFLKYNSIITRETGLSVLELTTCVELLIEECNIKLNLHLKIQKDGTWAKFTNEMERLNIPLEEWKLHFTDELNSALNVSSIPESFLIIDINNLNVECDKEKLIIFLELFSVYNINQSKYIYYGEKLPLETNPIVNLSPNQYLVFYQNELLTAIYDKLAVICRETIGQKFYKHRDKETESKVLEIFGLLFNEKKAKIFFNYSIDAHAEQDILIIHESIALIIEVKAGSFRAPMREPLKAYDKIKSDFKKVIQEAYDQCLRVEDAIEKNEVIDIYNSKAKLIESVKTKNITTTYSIIVTLDRFGLIQSDLSHLLKIKDNLPFPWCVNLDDLESFFLMLKKEKKSQNRFIEFLSYRELLHGRLIATDEIDVCCWYFRNKHNFKKRCNENHTFIFANPKESNMLDKMYYSKNGLGFKNEHYIDLKRGGKTLFMGAPK